MTSTRSVPGRWLDLCSADPDFIAIVHYVAGSPALRLTRQFLWDRAGSLASVLGDAGVRRGDVCAIILRHHPDFYALYMGVARLGAIPAVLAYPNARIHPDKYRAGLHGMAGRSGLDWIVTTRDLQATVQPLIAASGGRIRDIIFAFESAPREPNAIGDDLGGGVAPFLLQHSSGTTGLQKAVVLSHEAILTHIANYRDSIALTPTDKVVSWLPLYHDMGLIAAFHLPLASGICTIQIDPFEWVLAPQLLCDVITEERPTLCWLPNFAYSLIAERVREDEAGEFDLSSIRMFINCSEPIREASHARFAERLSASGVTPAMLTGCYAMAETTFAVTQSDPGRPARSVTVDRDALARGRVLAPSGASRRDCVSSGRPIPGCEVRILNSDGSPAARRSVGEIVVRSESMFDGYRNAPEKTEEVLRDGWYWTGDLGFVDDDELFVIGRRKEIIIVAGKNIYPEDIEDAVSAVPGVIPGRVVAFGHFDESLGTEQVWVIAESAAEGESAAQLETAIRQAAAAIDVTVASVLIKPPRWLIKSSAGKPSRSANRDRALEVLA